MQGQIKLLLQIAEQLASFTGSLGGVASAMKKMQTRLEFLEPSYQASSELLGKMGFASEALLEENMRLFVDHHRGLVAENTELKKIINDRDELMEQLRKVVLEEK